MNEAVVQLIDSAIGLAEELPDFVKTLIDPLEAAIMHVKPGTNAVQSLVMLSAK